MARLERVKSLDAVQPQHTHTIGYETGESFIQSEDEVCDLFETEPQIFICEKSRVSR